MIFKRGKFEYTRKHDFLRSVVRLCLVMMVLLTLDVIVMSVIAQMPPDSASLGVLMGGWCGELLLTLLKRKFEKEDKAEEKAEKSEDPTESVQAIGFEIESKEDESEVWNSGT